MVLRSSWVVIVELEQLATNEHLFTTIHHLAPFQRQRHVGQHLAGGTPLKPAGLVGEWGIGNLAPGAIPELDPVSVSEQIASSQWQQCHQADDFLC